jgi:hypothetical protein
VRKHPRSTVNVGRGFHSTRHCASQSTRPGASARPVGERLQSCRALQGVDFGQSVVAMRSSASTCIR